MQRDRSWRVFWWCDIGRVKISVHWTVQWFESICTKSQLSSVNSLVSRIASEITQGDIFTKNKSGYEYSLSKKNKHGHKCCFFSSKSKRGHNCYFFSSKNKRDHKCCFSSQWKNQWKWCNFLKIGLRMNNN